MKKIPYGRQNIDQKDKYDLLPFYYACQWSELWVIQKFIDMGANINDPDSQYFGLQNRINNNVEQGIEFLRLLKSNKAIINPQITSQKLL